MRRILDPSVGAGALVLPVASRLMACASVVCVDVDATALGVAKSLLASYSQSVRCVHGDFLDQVMHCQHLRSSSFDCVVMNPPYAAKKADWTEIHCGSLGLDKRISVPKEIAFFLRGIELLRKRGRLLAVLPASMVSASLFGELRNWLGHAGQFHYVHELPKFTFRGVEGRVYLVVFERGGTTSRVELRNHDLRTPECMCLGWSDLGELRRLDFGFQQNRRSFAAIVKATPELGWTPLAEIFDIRRGPRRSPRGPKIAMHTTDFDGDFWVPARRHLCAGNANRIQRGDLFMARVARRCLQTFGAIKDYRPVSWSDCVFRLRLMTGAGVEATLLSVRTVMGLDQAPHLLERGMGAAYVTESDLGSLLIPTKIAEMRPGAMQRYVEAVRSWDGKAMRQMERQTRQWILRRCGSARNLPATSTQ